MTDMPPAQPMDIVTRSVSLPRVTEYTVVRGNQVTTIAAQATASQNPTYYFSLQNANIGSGFFDQYRIPAIRFNIRSQQNAIGLTTNTTTTVTSIFCVIDYDDDTALASQAAALSYANCVVVPPGKSCSRTFRPHLAVGAYTGAFTGYANMSDLWLDAASNTVRHYGIKLWIPGVTAAQTQLQTWDIEVEYYIELRKAI